MFVVVTPVIQKPISSKEFIKQIIKIELLVMTTPYLLTGTMSIINS